MQRTTIQLQGQLRQQIKKLAHERKTTLQECLNDLIRLGLEMLARKTSKTPFAWHTTKAKPVSGFNPADRSYLDFLDKS